MGNICRGCLEQLAPVVAGIVEVEPDESIRDAIRVSGYGGFWGLKSSAGV